MQILAVEIERIGLSGNYLRPYLKSLEPTVWIFQYYAFYHFSAQVSNIATIEFDFFSLNFTKTGCQIQIMR